jgi:hypothetical protein
VALIPSRPDYVYVNDASQNTIVRLDRESGRSQGVMRFPGVPHPVPFGPPVAEFVPTSITPYANNLLVTNLVGFPFPRDQSTVQFVDLDAGTATPFIAAPPGRPPPAPRPCGPASRPSGGGGTLVLSSGLRRQAPAIPWSWARSGAAASSTIAVAARSMIGTPGAAGLPSSVVWPRAGRV